MRKSNSERRSQNWHYGKLPNLREMGWRRCNTNATPDGRSGRRVGDTTRDAAAALSGSFDQKPTTTPVTKPVPSILRPFAMDLSAVKSEVLEATPGASV